MRDQLGHDPVSGHLFLFTNKTRTRLKALVWDGSGLWVARNAWRSGRFRWPEAEGRPSVTMRSEELAMLVNGLDVKQTISSAIGIAKARGKNLLAYFSQLP